MLINAAGRKKEVREKGGRGGETEGEREGKQRGEEERKEEAG